MALFCCLAECQQLFSARVAQGSSLSAHNAFNNKVQQPQGHAQKVTGQCSYSYQKKAAAQICC